MKLVIVESPAKAKAIGKYLGAGYDVVASFGHVRDLPAKQGSVRPQEDFALTWEVSEKSLKPLKVIENLAKKANTLIFATDLDREGEGIAWHLLQYLKESNALKKNVDIQRISFNAVTKASVLDAIQKPQDINYPLVEAYLARLSLDYLVGFTLSPVLWRKLPGSRSAGRVQSVALRVVVEREQEILAFRTQEYWTIHGLFIPSATETSSFSAHLSHFQGEKLGKFAISEEAQANAMVQELVKHTYQVATVEKKRAQRQPAAPFRTSSLQQEASRKLGFSPARTMQLAQRLYEGIEIQGETVGLITYMRTDSLYLLPEFLQESQAYIKQTWGVSYLAAKPRIYKKSKHAQEAHEAIRPTDVNRSPNTVQNLLPDDQLALYKLIWDRTVASQMAAAEYDQTVATVTDTSQRHIFRATGSVLAFNGFLILYEETVEEDETGENAAPSLLPLLTPNEAVALEKLTPNQHFTQPPPRYTEASLVKKLEELGVGRPSTYARILQILVEREYVRKDKNRLIPEELGSLVVAFLRKFFATYVDYSFTASLEESLDDISIGEKSRHKVLQDFWDPFDATIQAAGELRIADVLTSIEEDVMQGYGENRQCPKCQSHTVGLRLGKKGPFVACSGYPACTYIANLSAEEKTSVPEQVLGQHPDDGQDIILKKGPYGWYVQWEKKRASLSTLFSSETITLDQALWLLALPYEMGLFPDTEKPIFFGIGRFGPYVKHEDRFFSVKVPPEELQDLSLEQAIQIVRHNLAKPQKPRPAKSSSKSTRTTKKSTRTSDKPSTKPSAKPSVLKTPKPKSAGSGKEATSAKKQSPKKPSAPRTRKPTPPAL